MKNRAAVSCLISLAIHKQHRDELQGCSAGALSHQGDGRSPFHRAGPGCQPGRRVGWTNTLLVLKTLVGRSIHVWDCPAEGALGQWRAWWWYPVGAGNCCGAGRAFEVQTGLNEPRSPVAGCFSGASSTPLSLYRSMVCPRADCEGSGLPAWLVVGILEGPPRALVRRLLS